ncbi:DNA-processing protein DprA [Pelagibius sp.]|uniref:DNA-processing protein DprA n=1 Tax=Pelagibius sp. TaxID=1931238 RepID=UPI0026358014|nr:DNA-processing protein DprA [Pelagibius sp.]
MQPNTIKPLDDEARLAWLRLIRSENVGPVVFRQLLDRFGSPAAALSALPEVAARAGGKRRIRICSQADAEAEMAATRRAGARLLAWCEPAYPAPLRELEDAPPLLIVLGDPAALSAPAVGIVGARNASANGRRFAQGLAAEIAEAGYAVVSGMARGIDTAAHLGALPRPSVAVLAGGVDVVYPPENDRLHRDLQDRGAVISEMPLGTKPQARHFPRRNRLISGLSCGLVIVEAAKRSGSLITARFAAEQGRDVFAVPGSPLDPRAAGCNHLIREGATLVESAAQILDDLRAPLPAPPGSSAPGSSAPGSSPTGLQQVFAPQAPPPPTPPIAERAEAGPNERRDLEELLGPEPIMVDELVRLSGLPIGVVHSALLDLELAGRIERHPGNRVARLYKAPADLL